MKKASHTKVAKDAKVGHLMQEIREKLATIEDHLIWLIKPEQRFQIGQRVEFSRRARRRGYPKRKRSVKGIVKGIDSFSLVVLLDFYTRPRSFHHAFFNPVSGPKLF